jgi:hypothetical protein
MAPERLKRNINCLQILKTARKPMRNALINNAPKDLILCLCDCAHNFLNGNIPFTEEEIEKLVRYQHILRYLASTTKRENIEDKKQLLSQNGGFLPLLLTPILSTLGTLLAEVLTK